MENKFILDACCGSRMFWFDKQQPNTIFCDIREYDKGFIDNRPNRELHPDMIMDFRKLEFPDKSFKLVVMDPPHLIGKPDGCRMTRTYGCLNADTWRSDIKKGFDECWRVLEDYGIHAIVNILQPIYEKIFIYDSFASRKNKGNHEGVKRLEQFIRKVSHNGKLIKKPFDNNSIQGYVLKADIRKYFDSMNHEVLINILKKKIRDKQLIDLIWKVLNNFNTSEGVGLPLGNYTSQFFANIYLNELDYYVKHVLKAKYYIRYVDDFVILHPNKKRLEYFMEHIKKFLPCLKVQLHPEKSSIVPLRNGINFLGYRIFFHYRLLRQRNIRTFKKRLDMNIELYKNKEIDAERLNCRIQGWLGHARFANTHNLQKTILKKVKLVTT